jgi:hypothetical protein
MAAIMFKDAEDSMHSRVEHTVQELRHMANREYDNYAG